ncbi:MAG: biotin/lipoyl-binding protein [Nitrospiraceae bacterium]|nr:biotin/lipoyl-binding protein [Nitrospiraceae bacterium]
MDSVFSNNNCWSRDGLLSKKPNIFILPNSTKRTNLKQVVSLTGRVKSNQKINLSFEKSGRISHIYVKNNDNVESGQPLLELDNQDLKIKLSQAKSRAEGNKIALLQARAQLKSQLAKLEKMKKGTRVEEIDLVKTKVSSYQQQLIQTKKDLEATKSKAEADLRNVYITTLSYLPSAVDLGKNALYQFSCPIYK